jgi:hypothetical protein
MEPTYVICRDTQFLGVDGNLYCLSHLFSDGDSHPVVAHSHEQAMTLLADYLEAQIAIFKSKTTDGVDFPWGSMENMEILTWTEAVMKAAKERREEWERHQRAERESTPMSFQRWVYLKGERIGRTVFALIHEGQIIGIIWETQEGDLISETGDDYVWHFVESHTPDLDEDAFYLSRKEISKEDYPEWVKTQQYGKKEEDDEEGDDE